MTTAPAARDFCTSGLFASAATSLHRAQLVGATDRNTSMCGVVRSAGQ